MTDQQLDKLFKDGLSQEQAFEGTEEQWILLKQKLKPSNYYFVGLTLLLLGSLFLLFYFNRSDVQSTQTTIVPKKETKQYNTPHHPKTILSNEKEKSNKKVDTLLRNDNSLPNNTLKPKNQPVAFSTLNKKNTEAQVQKKVNSNFLSTKAKNKVNIDQNVESLAGQKYNPFLGQTLDNLDNSSEPKKQKINDEQFKYDNTTKQFESNVKKPTRDLSKEETQSIISKKLNSIHTFLSTKPFEQLNSSRREIKPSAIFNKKEQNKKWTILAGLSYHNLLHKTTNINIKDSSSVIRNFGLSYTLNNKLVLGLHYKFNTVAKRIKQIGEVYNLPELPSLSGSENTRENISLIYERNLFNILLGYQAYQNKYLHFIPFVGLQSGYFPSHTIKYGVDEVYDEQNLTSLIPAKFYGMNDLLFGINAAINITGSISLQARYEYQLSLNNNYNWQTPHLISTFVTVKF